MRRTAVALAALLLAAGTSPVLAGGGLPKLANVDAGPHLAELYSDSPSLVTGVNTLTVQIRALPPEHVVTLALEGPDGARVDVPLTRTIVLGELEESGHSHAEDGDDHPAAPADDHAPAVSGAVSQSAGAAHGATSAGSHGTAQIYGASTSGQPPARDGHDSSKAAGPAPTAPAPTAHGGSQPGDAHGAATAGHGDRPVDADRPHAKADAHGANGHDAEAVEDHGRATDASAETYLARGSVSVPSTGTWTARLVIRDPHGEEVVGEAPLAVAEGGPNKLYLGFTGSLIVGSMLFGLIQRRRPDRPLSTTKDRN